MFSKFANSPTLSVKSQSSPTLLNIKGYVCTIKFDQVAFRPFVHHFYLILIRGLSQCSEAFYCFRAVLFTPKLLTDINKICAGAFIKPMVSRYGLKKKFFIHSTFQCQILTCKDDHRTERIRIMIMAENQ